MAGTIKLTTPGSGAVNITPASSIASDVTVNVPSVNGTLGVVQNNIIASGTAQASTSGTSIDFTGIPAGVKRVTVMFVSVSTNGASPVLLQLGAGSVATSGYAGSCFGALASSGFGVANYTNGFGLGTDGGAGYSRLGSVVLTLQGANTWTCAGVLGQNDTARINSVGGAITLSGALDRVRITTVNGTDTFDAGSINILWE